MTPLRLIRKKMGEMLLERNVVSQEQLNIALAEQKKNGGYLSQHLIALGFATEEDIATCLSNQYNFAYLPLKNYAIPSEVLKTIPVKWIKIYTLLPVDRNGDILSVAMADPLNEGVIQMLKQITGCEIAIFISTYSELIAAISKYFREELNDLEKHHIDPKDLEAIKTVNQFVQTKKYMGPERREFVRVKKETDIYFYFMSKKFQGRTVDISFGGVSFVLDNKSYGGVSFFSSVSMPLHTSLACRIFLKPNRDAIDVVLNVLRVEAIQEEPAKTSRDEPRQNYEIAGAFEFINSQDRESLLAYLRESVSADSVSRAKGTGPATRKK